MGRVMWYWLATFSGETGGPFQTEADAKAACIKFLTKREPLPNQVATLWPSIERQGWSVEWRV